MSITEQSKWKCLTEDAFPCWCSLLILFIEIKLSIELFYPSWYLWLFNFAWDDRAEWGEQEKLSMVGHELMLADSTVIAWMIYLAVGINLMRWRIS